jgi:hypothetical protein
MNTEPDIMPLLFDDTEITSVRVKVLPDAFETAVMDSPAVPEILRRDGYTYAAHDENAIVQFVVEHEAVAQLLGPLSNALTNYFPGAQLRLELSLDPESKSKQATLAVVVETGLPSADTFSRLERFDEDWWIDRTSPDVCVTVQPA